MSFLTTKPGFGSSSLGANGMRQDANGLPAMQDDEQLFGQAQQQYPQQPLDPRIREYLMRTGSFPGKKLDASGRSHMPHIMPYLKPYQQPNLAFPQQ